MATVKAEIDGLSKQVADISLSVQSARQEVVQYQLILADTRDRLDKLQNNLTVYIDTTFLAVTVILIWVGISQLGALLQAAELFSRREE